MMYITYVATYVRSYLWSNSCIILLVITIHSYISSIHIAIYLYNCHNTICILLLEQEDNCNSITASEVTTTLMSFMVQILKNVCAYILIITCLLLCIASYVTTYVANTS